MTSAQMTPLIIIYINMPNKKLTPQELYNKYDALHEHHERQKYLHKPMTELHIVHKTLSDVYYNFTLDLVVNNIVKQ